MENYRKAGSVEQPCPCPFPGLPEGTPVVRVRDGSKIRNLLRFALSRMEPGPGAPPGRQLLFTGTGAGVAKAVTCLEILKRRVPGLHQCTRLRYCTLQESWEPLETGVGLDPITVSRSVPALWALLSRDPLDGDAPGYQAPGSFDALWARDAKEERERQERQERERQEREREKRASGGGGGARGGGGGRGGRGGGGGRGGKGGAYTGAEMRGKRPGRGTPRSNRAQLN